MAVWLDRGRRLAFLFLYKLTVGFDWELDMILRGARPRITEKHA
jgi:hypothetical protein